MKTWYVISRSLLLVAFTFSLWFGYRGLYLHPCQKTQTYAVGQVDPSFGITRSQLSDLLEEVEYVWEEPSGIYTLFDQTPTRADITVNLIPLDQNTDPGIEFDKGDYHSRSGELNIYQFDDDRDLLLVLAHEFGHALDMDHVLDDQAIMSDVLYQNAGIQPALTADDIREFKRVCRRV